MKKIYLISVLLLSMVLAGCENSSEYRDFLDTQVKIENSDVVFTAAGGTGTIEIATEDFTSISDQSWCTLTTNGKIITVNATPNVSISGRTARVTVKSGDKVNYVSVSQAALVIAAARQVGIDGKGEILRVPYESAITPTIQSSESWLTALVDGNEIVLTAEPNPSLSIIRTATVSILDGFATITVTQATNYLTMDAYSATLDGRGETVKVGYDDTNPIIVQSNGAWLTATVVGDSVVLTAPANPNPIATRSTTVTVSVLDGQTTINVTQAIGEPDITINAVYNFLNLKNNGTSSRYRITDMSPRLDAWRTALKAAYPQLQEYRIETPRGSNALSFTLFSSNLSILGTYYLNFNSPGLKPLENPYYEAAFDAYNSTTYSTTQVSGYTNNTNFSNWLAFVRLTTGFTVIEQPGNIFIFRSIADPSDWFKAEAASW